MNHHIQLTALTHHLTAPLAATAVGRNGSGKSNFFFGELELLFRLSPSLHNLPLHAMLCFHARSAAHAAQDALLWNISLVVSLVHHLMLTVPTPELHARYTAIRFVLSDMFSSLSNQERAKLLHVSPISPSHPHSACAISLTPAQHTK